MDTSFNEYLEPSFHLNKLETEELEQTGFVITGDGFCVTKTDKIRVFKEFDEYETITLNGGKN